MHFMAAVELWVPYISKPPRAPYLVRSSVAFRFFSDDLYTPAVHPRPAMLVKQYQTPHLPPFGYRSIVRISILDRR